MRRTYFYALCLIALCLSAQAQMSYWWGQMVKKPDAKTSQEFFFLAGTNVTFTYTNNRVIINGAPGTNTSTLATNAVYATFATNWLGSNALFLLLQTNAFATNAYFSVWATNWDGSNSMWINVTNLVYNATNGLTFSQTNIYATNLIGLIPGNNIYFVTNGSGFLEINASNQVTPVLDIRTNEFNAFLGTNRFDTNVYIMGKLGINFTNFADADYTSSSIVWKRVPYNFPTTIGASLLFGPNSLADPSGAGMNDGSSIISKQDMEGAGSASATLELLGSPLFIGTEATRPLIFVIAGIPVGQINNSSGNLLMGRGNIAATSLFGTGYGGILGTNFIHSKQYVRAETGTVVNSNSWAKVPSFVVSGSSDAFNDGDTWYVSSNGFPHVLEKWVGGTIMTNRLYEAWAFMSLTNAQNINVAVKGTYYPITNFNWAVSHTLLAYITIGTITNTVEGWYRISINASVKAPTTSDAMDCDVMINGVADERIASHTTAPSGPNKYSTLAAGGILHLDVNDRVEIGITDTDSTGNIEVLHAQLTVGRP